LLLVDDGSTDRTLDVLAEIQGAAPASTVRVLPLPRNGGKAEAVRQGLANALGRGARLIGYADADLSTPFAELSRLLEPVEQGTADVVLGSRVALLGTHIERTRARHYLGRVFATAASLLLKLGVYDTQCGAKFFRQSPALESALSVPFSSSWAFDVELIGRLLLGAPGAPPIAPDRFVEIPLRAWRDVRGSHLKSRDMARAAFDLVRIQRALLAWERRAAQA
jgi:glycosyltransferase involved in cell wall biosynthesis